MYKKLILSLTIMTSFMSGVTFASDDLEPTRIPKRFENAGPFNVDGISIPLDITTKIAQQLNSDDAKSFSLVCKAASNAVDGRPKIRLNSDDTNGTMIDSAAFLRTLQTKRHLRCLMVGDALDNARDVSVFTLLRLCPNLLMLDLEGFEFENSPVADPSTLMIKCETVKYLNIADSDINEVQFNLMITHMPNLEYVFMCPCPYITEASVSLLLEKCLNLKVCSITFPSNRLISNDFLAGQHIKYPSIAFISHAENSDYDDVVF